MPPQKGEAAGEEHSDEEDGQQEGQHEGGEVLQASDELGQMIMVAAKHKVRACAREGGGGGVVLLLLLLVWCGLSLEGPSTAAGCAHGVPAACCLLPCSAARPPGGPSWSCA